MQVSFTGNIWQQSHNKLLRLTEAKPAKCTEDRRKKGERKRGQWRHLDEGDAGELSPVGHHFDIKELSNSKAFFGADGEHRDD